MAKTACSAAIKRCDGILDLTLHGIRLTPHTLGDRIPHTLGDRILPTWRPNTGAASAASRPSHPERTHPSSIFDNPTPRIVKNKAKTSESFTPEQIKTRDKGECRQHPGNESQIRKGRLLWMALVLLLGQGALWAS